MKICTKCKIEKDETEFNKSKIRKDGLSSWCKVCNNEYHAANKEKRNEKARQYREANKERVNEQNRRYQAVNKEKRNEYERERRQNDPAVHTAELLSRAICHAIKAQKAGRKWESIVGYTVTDLMKHLESQFTPEMNWENQGSYWHIDHKKPQSWFDQLDPKQFQACWALENLQPLEATENIRKGNRWEG